MLPYPMAEFKWLNFFFPNCTVIIFARNMKGAECT